MTNVGQYSAIVVVGGSNSLMKDGWVDKLRSVHPQPDNVLNLSIGAATSVMGLYRLLTVEKLPEDAVVLWEYALNESNYYTHRQPLAVLQRHLEWLLEICARRKLPVVPVVLYTKTEAGNGVQNPYRRLLADVIERYGLTSLDAQRLWKSDFAGIEIDELYRDDPHYSTRTPFLAALSQRALELAETAQVPNGRRVEGSDGFEGKDLSIVFPISGASARFANRILDCTIYGYEKVIEFHVQGRPLACYLIASRNDPDIEITSQERSIGPYSARITPAASGPQRQLKHLILWSPDRPSFESSGRVIVAPSAMTRGRPIVQHTMSGRPYIDGASKGGVIAMLVETGG